MYTHMCIHTYAILSNIAKHCNFNWMTGPMEQQKYNQLGKK